MTEIYVYNHRSQRATRSGWTQKGGKGLLHWLEYHGSRIAEFEYTPGLNECRSAKIDGCGWAYSSTTRARINEAFQRAGVGGHVSKRKGVLFFHRYGHSVSVWNGRSLTFDPREQRDCEGLRMHRVGYYWPTTNTPAAMLTTKDVEYDSIYVEARNEICAMIIARTTLPPEARIRGVYKF